MKNHILSLSHLFSDQMSEDAVICMENNGTHVTWKTFKDDVSNFTTRIKENKAKRWAIYCKDSYWFAVGLFALFYAGCEPVLLPNWRKGTLENHKNDFDKTIGDSGDELNILLDPTAVSSDREKFPALDSENIRLTIFTSGSTGEPKKIVKKLIQLESEVCDLERLWGDKLDDSLILSTVSHQHIYGLLFRLLWPLAANRCFMREDISYPEQVIESVQNFDKTVLISSPALLKRMFIKPDKQTDFHPPVMVFSSGGPLSFDAAQLCKESLDVWPVEVLGSTETGGVGWRQQTPENGDKWRCFHNVKLSLSDEGRLIVQSPYLGDKTGFIMGDCASLIDDQYFELSGRADRIVKVEEKRISLVELEKTLDNSEWVNVSSVFMMNEAGRQIIACVVVLSEAGQQFLLDQGKRAIVDLLKAYLKQYFELIVIPRKFRFVDSLPYNSQGKLSQSDIKALFL
ncbi:MAG: AMP-binding protein [Gammaproteobacteria bacterium]|nr:AMP-binding protein [Gammaproteobacteria bacterium]MDH5592800.1 AMP-binding protein [Gammaproteobacteria bacterium]